MSSSKTYSPVAACVLLAVQLLTATGFSQGPNKTERVLIQTPKPYTRVVAGIEALGGKVTNEFKYSDAISAEVPSGALVSLRALVGDDAIEKDADVPKPGAVTLVHRTAATSTARQSVGRSRSSAS